MKKFRRSSAAKIIAFVLAAIFGALITANAAFAVILYRNNLFLSDESSIRYKIFSYLAESTINDIVNYYDCNMNYISATENDGSNIDYWQSENALYSSKYNSANSNIFFTVSDAKGETVLKSSGLEEAEDPDVLKNAEYIFNRTFIRTFYTDKDGNRFFASDNYKDSDRVTEPEVSMDNSDIDTDGETSSLHRDETVVGETESRTYEDDTTSPTAQQAEHGISGIVVTKTAKTVSATPEFLFEKSTYPSMDEPYTVNTDESNSYIMLPLQWEADPSLNGKYLFSENEGLNHYIYSYCTDEFRTARIDGSEAPLVYFQSSYTVDNSGNVTESIDKSQLPEGITKTEEKLTVKLYIPHGSDFFTSDIYSFAGKAVSFGVDYRNALVPVTILYFLFLAAAVIFLFYSAGYTVKAEAPVSGGLHKIPFDLATLIYLAILILGAVFADNFIAVSSYTGLIYAAAFLIAYGIALLTLSYIESVFVRIRSRELLKNTLIGRFIRLVRRTVRTSGLFGKTVIIYLAELAVIAVAVLLVMAIDNYIIPALLAAVILLPVTLAVVYEFYTVWQGAERFSKGDLSSKISGKLLIGPFRRFADDLNNINDTVNNAVKKQLKSESMKTELITNVSHDLKTPLTSIVNYIDLLDKLGIDDPTAQEYIEVISRQAQRLKKLTIDIVDASKAATGNIEVHPERLDLRVMLSQTDGEYCDRLDKNALSLIISVPEAPVFVNVDGRLLWRVFDNIIGNVCKYSMPGTRVYLSLTAENGNAEVTLRNISKSELNIAPEELTERFVRGDSSRNTEGSGLGLSIASSLTELLGGRFKIDIDGDLFKVTLSFPCETDTAPEGSPE